MNIFRELFRPRNTGEKNPTHEERTENATQKETPRIPGTPY
jgi:hypothetical protein